MKSKEDTKSESLSAPLVSALFGWFAAVQAAGFARLLRRWSFPAGLLLLSGAVQASERPPNVVFFLVDDLGWRDLGCFGSTFHQTPHIDRLAGQGVRFTQAYAACHVCSPTRASILTGKYPARLQLTDYLPGRRDQPFQKLRRVPVPQYLPPEEITLAEAAGGIQHHVLPNREFSRYEK